MTSQNSNRRSFLMSIIASASAPMLIPSTVLGENSPTERLTIGFIGTGNNGYNWLDPFLRDERTKVVAVCDVNK